MQYFLKSAKGERGPFTEDDLRQLVERGKINGSTPVRTDRQTTWIPLSQLPPPPGHDAAEVDMVELTVTPAKPFVSMIPPQERPPVPVQVTEKRKRRFRVSTLFMVLGVLSITLIPLWIFSFVTFFLAMDTDHSPGARIGNWVEANWFGVAAGMLSSGFWISFSLIVRDFERE